MQPDDSTSAGKTHEPLALDLRPWQADDLPLMHAILGDPLMTTHLGGPESPDKLRGRLERYVRMNAGGNDRMFVIVLGSERLPVGSVGYWEKEWQGQRVWETGWHVLPAFQRRGIATRAIAMLIGQARSRSLHHQMHAFPSIYNAASNAVCRRLGFTLQGETDFEFPPGNRMRCHDWRLDLRPTPGLPETFLGAVNRK